MPLGALAKEGEGEGSQIFGPTLFKLNAEDVMDFKHQDKNLILEFAGGEPEAGEEN